MSLIHATDVIGHRCRSMC